MMAAGNLNVLGASTLHVAVDMQRLFALVHTFVDRAVLCRLIPIGRCTHPVGAVDQE